MANIAVQRIKREFKEVLKSEEVSDQPLRPLMCFPGVFKGTLRCACVLGLSTPVKGDSFHELAVCGKSGPPAG